MNRQLAREIRRAVNARWQTVLSTHLTALALRDLGVQEYPFDVQEGGREWRFDRCWPDLKVAVELEGATGWMVRGRHIRPDGFDEDCVKYNTAIMAGWKLLRFSSRQVESGQAARTIVEALSRLQSELPDPPGKTAGDDTTPPRDATASTSCTNDRPGTSSGAHRARRPRAE